MNKLREYGLPIAGGLRVLDIWKAGLFLLLIFVTILWAPNGTATDTETREPAPSPGVAIVLDVQDAIGPATRDFLIRSLEKAAEVEAGLVVVRLDTPGGLDASTRDIVKAILSSKVPVAVHVTPAGARAASAGTYILYSSAVAVMSPATTVGAATPVPIMGAPPGQDKPASQEKAPEKGQTGKKQTPEKDDTAQEQEADDSAADSDDDRSLENDEPGKAAPSGDAMSRKVINDSVAFIRGLAEKHGRNADWAESAVREAVSVTAAEALELGVIDFIAADIDELLEKADGMVVDVNGQKVELHTSGLTVERLEPDWRSQFLSVITNPTIAYILLLVGIYGLILEGYNPGAMLPGVVGGICLLMALYALQMLPVNYAGLALIVLGIILMIAEVMAPSFGALGFGGIIAMVIGSIILIDTDVPGFMVSRALIGGIATVSSLGLMAIIWLAVRARQRPVVSGREQLMGARGEALESFERQGSVFVHGERWAAHSESPVHRNQAVKVIGRDGLTLMVHPLNGNTQEQKDV
jgi:membrane-bound serine protease (ClpP class)